MTRNVINPDVSKETKKVSSLVLYKEDLIIMRILVSKIQLKDNKICQIGVFSYKRIRLRWPYLLLVSVSLGMLHSFSCSRHITKLP